MKRCTTLMTVAVLVALLVAGCGATSEPTPVPREAIDSMFDVGGHELYLRCEGEGSPAVVLEHDINTTSASWLPIFKSVAEHTYTCCYDRAGAGRSEASPDLPRTSGKIADELHLLLETASVQGPFVLVGHWDAASNVIVFTDRYPDETVGLVLVDGTHPGIRERESPITEVYVSDTYETLEGLFDFKTSWSEAAQVTSLGDLPLVVLSRGQTAHWSGLSPDKVDAYQEMWMDLQRELAALSTNSKQITAENSTQNDILLADADLVAQAIIDLVDEWRAQ